MDCSIDSPPGYAPMHRVTPLIRSESLSDKTGHNIWLNMEIDQVSGSFKPRGIGRACWKAVQKRGKDVHLVIASGGNGGLAAALSAQTLGVKCTACVHNTTAKSIIDRLEGYGAIVNQATGGWEVVDANARRIVEEDPNGEYIHPWTTLLVATSA
jgi:threonine dehydratase